MSQFELLQFLVDRLNAVGIPHMVSGSVASGYYGEPRATYDIDLVIEADIEQVKNLAGRVAERCYVSESAAQDAVKRRAMFNVVDLQTGIKVDLILRKDRPYSLAEFARRRPAIISKTAVNVVSPEDCILSKLEWAMLGDSDRQYSDAQQVMRTISSAKLDVEYLQHWAQELNVSDALNRLLRETQTDG